MTGEIPALQRALRAALDQLPISALTASRHAIDKAQSGLVGAAGTSNHRNAKDAMKEVAEGRDDVDRALTTVTKVRTTIENYLRTLTGGASQSGEPLGATPSSVEPPDGERNQGRVHPNVPPYEGGKVVGVLRVGATEEPLVSGEDGHGRWLKENLPAGSGSGLTRAWTHVEGHASGFMRKHEIQQAELFINKAPCATGAAKCRYVLHKLLPSGSVLDVRFPSDSGGITTWRFVGGVKGWSELA